VVEEGKDPLLPSLEQGVVYTWEQLGSMYGFPPDYLGRAGELLQRMLSSQGDAEAGATGLEPATSGVTGL